MYQNIKNKNDAKKIVEEFSLIKLDISSNNKILNLIVNVYEYLDEKDLMFLHLAMIEINKKNNDLAIFHLKEAKKISKRHDTLNKINKIEKKILEK